MLQKAVISAIGHPKGPWSIDRPLLWGRERDAHLIFAFLRYRNKEWVKVKEVDEGLTYVGHVDVSVCETESEKGRGTKEYEASVCVRWKLKERAGEHCNVCELSTPTNSCKHGNGMLSSYNNDPGHLIVISPLSLSVLSLIITGRLSCGCCPLLRHWMCIKNHDFMYMYI